MRKSTLIALLMGISIVFHIIIGVPFAEHEEQFVNEENKRDFLTSTLQATAAMVGIVFAISIVIIEHSASNYSPRILELFKKDRVFIFILSFGLFTIAFISMTILNDWNTVFASSSLFLWNLVFLGIYLWYILTKINPTYVVKEVISDMILQIEKIKKELPKQERKYLKNDTTKKMGEMQKLSPDIMRSFILKQNQQLMSEILNDEETLQHIILDSFRKEEYQTSKNGLENYKIIVEKYIQIIPNYQWVNDQFIERIISRFENYATKAIEKNDIIFLRQIISSFGELGISLTKIPELQYSMEPPWPVTRQIHSLSRIGKQSIQNGMWDGVIDSINNLGDIGIACLQMYKKDGYASHNILEIGKKVILARESITLSHISYQSLRLIQHMIAYKSDDTRLRMTIEGLRDFFVNVQRAQIQNLTSYSLFFNTPNEISIRTCVEQAFLVINEEFPQIETKWREDFEKSVVSSLIDLLGNVGIANKVQDAIITKYCAENLTTIAHRCLEQTFHTVNNGHEDEVASIIRFLHRMHQYDTENNSFSDEIPLRLAEVAIICIENNLEDLSKKCIETISKIAHQSLKVDKYGYESNRMLRQLNLVGCAAIEMNHQSTIDAISETIAKFDEEYMKKFNILPSDELNLEQTSWEVDPFERKSQIYDMVKIMKMSNRIKFEYQVTQKRIEELKKIK